MTTQSSLGEGPQNKDVYQFRAEGGRSLSETVVRAVASISGKKLVAADGLDGTDARGTLEPLYNTISPDALNTLFSSKENTKQPSGEVEFVYEGYEVAVESTGAVTVTEKQ